MEVTGPLAGVRVLDLSRVLAGPFCTMILGDFGAEVIKVEAPSGDETRQWGPPFVGKDSAYFTSINRNKKSIVVDLRKSSGGQVIRRLVKWADVLVENFRPGVAERLGLAYDVVRGLNPNIVYCSISGFGQSGPYREKPGYDIIALAMSGLMSITGEVGRPPVKFGVPIADLTTAIYAAFSIVSALLHREKKGSGQYIDISLLDTQVYLLTHQAANFFATGEEPERLGSAHPNICPYQALETRDGYMILAVGNERMWRDFCNSMDLGRLVDDRRFRTNSDRIRNRSELIEILARIFRENSTSHLIAKLEAVGVPCAPVKTLGEALEDPHVRYRAMVMEIEHKSAGRFPTLGVPAKFSETPGSISLAPPGLGEHTDHVLAFLGYSEDEIRSLRSEGSVA